MNTKKPHSIASLAAGGRSGKPVKLFGPGREHMPLPMLQAERMARAMTASEQPTDIYEAFAARCCIEARYHGDTLQYAADMHMLPPELLVPVATEAPRTIARLDKYAQRMRRHATRSGKRRPTPEESREAIARLYGFKDYAAAVEALSGKQEDME